MFKCEPVPDVSAPAPPTGIMAREVQVAAARPALPSLCPSGQVPYPVRGEAEQGFKAAPPIVEAGAPTAPSEPVFRAESAHSATRPGAHIARRKGKNHKDHRDEGRAARIQEPNGLWYSWAQGINPTSYIPGGPVTEVWDEQTNEQPYIAATNSHSLAQIWAIDNSTKYQSTVELGWTEAPGQYPDVQVHLFIATEDGNVYREGGYIGLSATPWVQVSTTEYPNMVVTHTDHAHFYAISQKQGNWWIWYEGQWVGYIPHNAWLIRFPEPHYLAWGGEVATPEHTTCTDMGNGLLGGATNSADVAYTYWVNNSYAEPGQLKEAFASDLGQYSPEQWYPKTGLPYSFHYGGPGWC